MKKTIFFLTLLLFVVACTKAPTKCTLEAKLCPDGTYVGRVGPNCEFEPCQRIDQPLREKTYFVNIANFGEDVFNIKINYEGEIVFEDTLDAAEMELTGHPKLSFGELTLPENTLTLEIETGDEKYSFDINPEVGEYFVITYLGDAVSFRQGEEPPMYD